MNINIKATKTTLTPTIRDFVYGKLQILEMDYLVNDLSMFIILPKDNNLNTVENALNKEQLDMWTNNMDSEKVEVSIPTFSFETKYSMAQDLEDMGMPTAFDEIGADFTGMWNRQRDENLYISNVIHQAFINVTESGTEAAAATAVIMSVTEVAVQTPQPKVFNADHPFIFIIQQKETGNILFMGRVVNPLE